MKNKKKNIIIFSIVIAIFIIGIVPKEFQNDTFFNVAVGRYISNNGIDMKEHFSWCANNLYYTYSHWAFDLVIYTIYNFFNFTGIYIATIIFSIIIGITLFILLTKRNNNPIVAFFITLTSLYTTRYCLTARSQIISFLCFIIEIYCIENFIETNKKRYAITIIILSIIVANFHSATWPLVLVLFLPYVASGILNIISLKNFRKLHIKKLERKIKKLSNDSPKIENYKKEIERLENLNIESSNYKSTIAEYKIIRKSDYNLKNLFLLILILLITGLLTPTHGTSYTYIIKSMFGKSNFGDISSMYYISEMLPIIPINHLSMILFCILLITSLTFLPSKIKTEHAFLVLGLLLMTLQSGRYVYLLVFLGSYVLTDLITQILNMTIPDDIESLNNFFASKLRYSNINSTYYYNFY